MVIGPITLEAKVHVANDAEGVVGSATVGLAPGKSITLEDLHRAIGQTLAALPEGFRLLEPDEFFNKVLVKEKTGSTGNFATPASFNYDTEALAGDGRAAYTPEQEGDPEQIGEDDNWGEDEDEV